jgi:hypothetical protein
MGVSATSKQFCVNRRKVASAGHWAFFIDGGGGLKVFCGCVRRYCVSYAVKGL